MSCKSVTSLLLFIRLIDFSVAIQCFTCSVITEIIQMDNQATVIPACSTFDGSPKFIVECPYSTMCLKTIHTMYLINGIKRITTTLGCAQQKYSQHVLRGKVWEEEHLIKDIYPEDCITLTENNMAAATKTHCYCRGNLCNFSNKIHIATSIIWVALSVFTLRFCFQL